MVKISGIERVYMDLRVIEKVEGVERGMLLENKMKI